MSIRTFLLAGLGMIVLAGTANAQEYGPSGAPASWAHPINDSPVVRFFQVDRAEYRLSQNNKPSYIWDAQGWIGTDLNKFWVKTEGEGEVGSPLDRGEFQGLYSRMVSSFFNVQAGIRQDFGAGPSPTYAVVGLQGLAPYVFEVDSAIFLSDDGDLTARIEAEYDILFTQRLIGQPRVEANFAAQDVNKLGIGSGLSTLEAGFRLRYEFRREVAPYIGVAWEQALGGTADMKRLAGNKASTTSFVAGIRLWF
ncbi:MAG: copper resistance protein B [Robiginitomaculum sp.]|nr:copper resistance protein B [Robiginitomaculum sp.]MDQ7078661.1 copper resistance protein B [Robiginitomaculum sp.]